MMNHLQVVMDWLFLRLTIYYNVVIVVAMAAVIVPIIIKPYPNQEEAG